MNSLTYMIGLDIGTTSTKAVLFERSGKVVASANEEYPLYTPSASIAEQDPDEIFSAVVTVVRQIMKKAGWLRSKSASCRSARRCTASSRSIKTANR